MTQPVVPQVRAAVAIPLTPRGEILLQKKDSGYHWHPYEWCFFGGQVKQGEEPRSAVIRELEEEIGIQTMEPWTFVREYGFSETSKTKPDKSREGLLYIFKTTWDGNMSKLKLREGGGVAIFSYDELSALPMPIHNKTPILDFYRTLRE